MHCTLNSWPIFWPKQAQIKGYTAPKTKLNLGSYTLSGLLVQPLYANYDQTQSVTFALIGKHKILDYSWPDTHRTAYCTCWTETGGSKPNLSASKTLTNILMLSLPLRRGYTMLLLKVSILSCRATTTLTISWKGILYSVAPLYCIVYCRQWHVYSTVARRSSKAVYLLFCVQDWSRLAREHSDLSTY